MLPIQAPIMKAWLYMDVGVSSSASESRKRAIFVNSLGRKFILKPERSLYD